MTILMAPHWTLSRMCRSLLYWALQNWTQYCSYGFSSAEERGRITSFNLLATCLLVQPRIPPNFIRARSHCWIMYNFLSSRIPASFSAKTSFSWVAPANTSSCIFSSHDVGLCTALRNSFEKRSFSTAQQFCGHSEQSIAFVDFQRALPASRML